MSPETQDLLRDLAMNAESVCRHYLSAGRREGGWWRVGDLQNTAGGSLYVRLTGPLSGPGARGHWRDAATGEHGDLLDLLRARTGLTRFADLLAEARAHLGRPPPLVRAAAAGRNKSSGGMSGAAARLFAASGPVAGSLAELYLRSRGLTQTAPNSALRFHPACGHREAGQTGSIARPALIAAVTDGAGAVRGVQRTWLATDRRGKAAVATPRRALGSLLGHAVRIGPAAGPLAIGEGIETLLSLREAAPTLTVWAALSAGNLGAVLLPAELRHLLIACDRDPAGAAGAERLAARASAAGVAVRVLVPRLGDFNDDLRAFGREALRQHLAEQLGPEDRQRLWG